MNKKRFELSDGTTKKFWSIVLRGAECLIEFGRVDSMGVSQAKQFGSADEARNAFDKLIEEKKTQGYKLVSEESDEGASVIDINANSSAPVASGQSGSGQMPSAPAAPADASPPTSNQPVYTLHSLELPADPENVMTLVRLDARDWFWAKWRNLSALERAPELQFDPAPAIKSLAKLGTRRISEVPWSAFDLPMKMSKPEAHFWLSAMTGEVRLNAKQTAESLKTQTFGDITPQQAQEKARYIARPEIIIALFNLLPFEQLIDMILNSTGQQTAHLAFGFGRYIVPYLPAAERASLANRIRPKLNPARLQERVHWHWAPPEFYLAAHLGMHEEVLAVVSRWQREADWTAFGYPEQIIFGLCDPTLVSKYIHLFDSRYMPLASLRAWIAHTGFTGLDYVYEKVANDANNDRSIEYFEILDLFPAPNIVHYVLQLHEIAASKIRTHARKWMERNREVAIQVLTELALRDKKLAKAAQEMLNNLNYQSSPPPAVVAESASKPARKQDHAGSDHQAVGADDQPALDGDQVAEEDQSMQAPLSLPEGQGEGTEGAEPDWLIRSIKAVAADKKLKPVDWIRAANLPAIAVQQKKLSTEQMEAVLLALKASTLHAPHSLVSQLKNHANQSSLDAFVWDLFERWLAEDGPIKEKWAMASLGLLGSDKTALQLTPLIRKWPGESFHQRAIFGLECLEQIGTDTAIMLINGVAQKLKYKPLQEKANACMNGIADARNMSREELEDRIVPDCDLNRQGTRVFDFGPRQFTLLIGADLLPMVQDKDGIPKADLPKANAADDAVKTQEATEEWKLLKKQLKEILKIQAVRLEQAMIKQRRWRVPDFEGLLVQHPLLGHIARRVIWLAYDADGQPIGTFRVTGVASAPSGSQSSSGSQTPSGSQSSAVVHYEDSLQAPFDLDRAAEVSVAHTMHFSEDGFRAWQTVLSRYPISPPFPQLNRQVYSLPAGTERDTELTCFDDVFVTEETLVRTLESHGWTRGAAGENGIFEEHTKVFDCDKVTAVVQYDGIGMQAMGDERQSIDRLFFLAGRQNKKISSEVHGAIRLGDIDPIVISEVLADLHLIASKGQVGSIKSD